MTESKIEELAIKLSKDEYEIKKLNDTIKELSFKDPIFLKEENYELEITHKLCVEDIKNYKEELIKLTELKKKNEEKILNLKKENEKLKKSKKEQIPKNEPYKKLINNLKDLSNSIAAKLVKKEEKNNNEDIKEKKEQKYEIKNLKEKTKKKEEYTKKFNELTKKSNEFNHKLEEQNGIIEDYKQYLNEVNQQVANFKEKLNISIINERNNDDNNVNKKIDEIYNQIDTVSVSLIDLMDIIFKIKNEFGQNMENLLNEIKENLNNLDKKENQNENYDNILEEIGKKIVETQKIFSFFEENRDKFYDKNHNVEEEMNKLKYLYKQYGKEYKSKRTISRSIIKSKIQNNQNTNKTQDNNSQNNTNNSIVKKKTILGESFLFTTKDIKSKEDLYKTTNLFKDNEQDIYEMYLEDAQLLRKNYHEICYVYDDYEIHDIYYDLKAVGLGDYEYFRKCAHGFYYDREVEIQSFLIDGVQSNFTMRGHSIEFDIELKNFETIKIHIIFKSTKNLGILSNGELEERSIYRTDYYGLDKSLSGQMAKFSLILKGSFDIVNFSNYFLIRNKNNSNEIEYMWGGRVPYGGKMTEIMFSKKKATWSFCFSSKIYTNNNFIKDTKYYLPIEFIGGNNDIININPQSPQSTNLILDEENRQYIVTYRNTYYKEAEFIIKGELQNKCKGEWLVDLTDEDIEKKMPQEDVLCKAQLEQIARKIIQDFDRDNKDSDFEFLDYMKIGMWVKKNIRYDLSYVGKIEYSAIDIYNNRVGVCHHFTKLSNALLYSLGYKVIYCTGYTCQQNKIFKTTTGHAWSLIKIGDKWFPFDSTWGIFTGKLPVGHIFATFYSKVRRLVSTDQAKFDRQEVEGKYIE